MTTSRDKSGRYLKLQGKEEPLLQHPTDFTVIGQAENVKKDLAQFKLDTKQITTNITRVISTEDNERDNLMAYVRQSESKYVAHHVYKFEDSDDEVLIDDRILLTLKPDSLVELEKIKQEYHLEDAGRMGKTYILRVTTKTRFNPLKIANKIAKREGVKSCNPHILIPLQTSHAPEPGGSISLFKRQWHLDSTQEQNPELAADAGIHVTEAWQFGCGKPEIVIAVIDDGFDLDHPAFREKNIDPHQKNFVQNDSDASSRDLDIHGTPVASIATASRFGGAIIGVAPDCTLLPIRVNLDSGTSIGHIELFSIFKHASDHADVVNCSFGSKPTEMDLLLDEFVDSMTELTVSGGRKGNGLVIVFGAGNDDAPTNLKGADNKNGVWFVLNGGPVLTPTQIPPGKDVTTKFPRIPGVVVVGAVTSLNRKAGYSNWGEHLTVMAPSNNFHEMAKIPDGVKDEIKAKFNRNYPGLPLVAATNRADHGQSLPRLDDILATSKVQERLYTAGVGGTSSAAPIVTGVVALMLSVKPGLSARQVIEILKSTADKADVLDFKLDLEDDPNLQGDFSGAFVDGKSRLFGAGKVNAFKAVKKALETVPDPPPDNDAVANN